MVQWHSRRFSDLMCNLKSSFENGRHGDEKDHSGVILSHMDVSREILQRICSCDVKVLCGCSIYSSGIVTISCHMQHKYLHIWGIDPVNYRAHIPQECSLSLLEILNDLAGHKELVHQLWCFSISFSHLLFVLESLLWTLWLCCSNLCHHFYIRWFSFPIYGCLYTDRKVV